MKARAADDSGNLQPFSSSVTVTFSIAPAAPTGVTATATSTGINLAWNAVTGATGYNVYRASSSNGTYTRLNASTPVTTITYTDHTATAGNWYYRVRAVNAVGESANSTTASATLSAPAAPTG